MSKNLNVRLVYKLNLCQLKKILRTKAGSNPARGSIQTTNFIRSLVQLKANLKTILKDKLEPEQLNQIYRSYDIIGNIAVIRIPKPLQSKCRLIAETIMDIHKEVKSVWQQVSSVDGNYRLRNLRFILGKKTTETIYKEHGCVYKIDLRKAYFSPRLSFERLRIARMIHPKETVLNMFSGVGCFSIASAKHSDLHKVYSVDINPFAFQYLRENIRLNRVEKTVIPLLGDAKNVTEQTLQKVCDRVLMPLPEKAYDYLEFAVLALKPVEGMIHYYDFEFAKKNENPVKKAEKKVSKKLNKLCENFQMKFGRIVRPIGPGWYQIGLDIQIMD